MGRAPGPGGAPDRGPLPGGRVVFPGMAGSCGAPPMGGNPVPGPAGMGVIPADRCREPTGIQRQLGRRGWQVMTRTTSDRAARLQRSLRRLGYDLRAAERRGRFHITREGSKASETADLFGLDLTGVEQWIRDNAPEEEGVTSECGLQGLQRYVDHFAAKG